MKPNKNVKKSQNRKENEQKVYDFLDRCSEIWNDENLAIDEKRALVCKEYDKARRAKVFS